MCQCSISNSCFHHFIHNALYYTSHVPSSNILFTIYILATSARAHRAIKPNISWRKLFNIPLFMEWMKFFSRKPSESNKVIYACMNWESQNFFMKRRAMKNKIGNKAGFMWQWCKEKKKFIKSKIECTKRAIWSISHFFFRGMKTFFIKINCKNLQKLIFVPILCVSN